MKIYIYPQLKNLLDMLSTEFDYEVGGYLVGEINKGEIILKELLIPDSQVSASHVEITAQQQLELRKKYGAKKVSNIIGHWHSHHNLGCFWSGQDQLNMRNIMQDMISKKFFVFIVSSKGEHLIKICVKDPFTYEITQVDLIMKNLYLDMFRNKIKNMFGRVKLERRVANSELDQELDDLDEDDEEYNRDNIIEDENEDEFSYTNR